MKKNPSHVGWQFIDDNGTFRLQQPHLTNYLYFPLVNHAGMISVVTPTLHGDIKTGQNTFFSQPLSVDDLHNTRSARNFWVYVDGHGPWSLTGNAAAQIAKRFEQDVEQVTLEAGLLWHKLIRENQQLGLKAEITNVVPEGKDQIELIWVTIVNTGSQARTLTPTAAIPIFGRSADNLRDHRHVTSLLNRITCRQDGILVCPTLAFDERGHIPNTTCYAVFGWDDQEQPPQGFFPVLEDFIGEGGSLDWPRAIIENRAPTSIAGDTFAGYEALGGLRFPMIRLEPGQQRSWVLVLAVLDDDSHIDAVTARYDSVQRFDQHLEQTKKAWSRALDRLRIQTGDSRFDGWMRWVSCQPILRRLLGNSFLPYHDYGRGGRGWRDLWQDILALLLMDRANIAEMLLGNFAGVRMDGSNATIIGSRPGEFKADRNEIPRVWMDHGAWPWLTIKLYLDQSGDLDFLLREQAYFKDHLTSRARRVDKDWVPDNGTELRTADGEIYRGSVLEHLLVQHVTAFFHVGEHNIIQLEDGDWNDGLDMASDRGESVAFTALYASNLNQLAAYALELKATGVDSVSLASELLLLLDRLGDPVDYAKPKEKRQRLNEYFDRVERYVSGERVDVALDDLAADLRAKADHLHNHLRTQEWVQDDQGHGWFNGYYDNDGQRLEGGHPLGVRVTLTGQVFPLMGETATEEQACQIVETVDDYLYDPSVGGYRLNTNFGEVMMNLGRAFGFAYGHKENGAMFSHMAVMYANALYQRGLVREGFKVLDTIYRHSVDFSTSRIYPGIPEYFNARGRGMYTYLTGSASWYLLTMVTEVFGVRGCRGDLILQPQLVKEQYDSKGEASIHAVFASRRLKIRYQNPHHLEHDQIAVKEIQVDGERLHFEPLEATGALIRREKITALVPDRVHFVSVSLGNHTT